MIYTELIKQQEDSIYPKLMYMGDRNTIVLVSKVLLNKGGYELMGTILKTNDSALTVGEVIATNIINFSDCNDKLVLSNRPVEKTINI